MDKVIMHIDVNNAFLSWTALDLLEKEKNVNKEFFISALESALTSAYKKNFGEGKSASVKLNPEKNTIKVLAYKTVVDEVVESTEVENTTEEVTEAVEETTEETTETAEESN